VVVHREGLHKLALGILHTMSLICKIFNCLAQEIPRLARTDDHMNPFDLTENGAVLDNVLIGAKEDLKLSQRARR